MKSLWKLSLALAALLATPAYAADTKISALTDGTACLATDDIPAVRGGANRRCQPSAFQASDADLTTYAGITPSANVQTMLAAADNSAIRTAIGLAIGTNVQAYDADLTTYAGITPAANVQTFLGAADYAAMKTQLALTIGTNVQAYDADLTTYAGITPSANVQTFLGAADYAAMKTQLALTIGTNVQAYDADLTTYAGITPSANVQTMLGSANNAAIRSNIGLRANEYCYALSDYNTTAVTAANGLATEYLPAAFTVTGVRAYTRTAPTGTMTIDVNEANTTILSTKLTIDANEKTSGTAAAAAVISDSSIAANAEITVDVDSTTGGKGLVVCIEGTF